MKIGDKQFSFNNSYIKLNLPRNNKRSFILSLKLFLILTISIFFISAISAAQIDFLKNSENFSQGETLIAKVSGNFVEKPTNENVVFYREHVRIPMVYEF